MSDRGRPADGFILLADESASWKVGGLSQIERLTLAVNEYVANEFATSKADVFVLRNFEWRSDLPPLDEARLENLRIVTSLPERGQFYVLTTRLFVDRAGLAEFLSIAPIVRADEIGDEPGRWSRLSERFEPTADARRGEDGWRILKSAGDIPSAERQLLDESAKSQDGFVARVFNRPISRAVTHLLLPLPITPTAWTIAIFLLPLLGACFLLHGSYLSLIVGTLLYHGHSILDGCDGEIARIKYLESDLGGRIDDFCDFAAAFVFLVALGIGLGRSSSWAPHFFRPATEGIVCALLVAINEILLRTRKERRRAAPAMLGGAVYARHRGMIQQSGLLVIGDRAVWWLVQLTKRDVGILFFVILAMAGLAQSILHLWLLVATIALGLTTSACIRDHVEASSYA